MRYEPPHHYPLGVAAHVREELLPPGMVARGYKLLEWAELVDPIHRTDPWVLYDAEGRKVAEWLWEPTMEELMRAARQGQGT